MTSSPTARETMRAHSWPDRSDKLSRLLLSSAPVLGLGVRREVLAYKASESGSLRVVANWNEPRLAHPPVGTLLRVLLQHRLSGPNPESILDGYTFMGEQQAERCATRFYDDPTLDPLKPAACFLADDPDGQQHAYVCEPAYFVPKESVTPDMSKVLVGATARGPTYNVAFTMNRANLGQPYRVERTRPTEPDITHLAYIAGAVLLAPAGAA